MDYGLIHELIFGALVGNIALLLGFLRFGYKVWKEFDVHMNQHHQLWDDFCYREGLRQDRVAGNIKRQALKKHKFNSTQNEEHNDD